MCAVNYLDLLHRDILPLDLLEDRQRNALVKDHCAYNQLYFLVSEKCTINVDKVNMFIDMVKCSSCRDRL